MTRTTSTAVQAKVRRAQRDLEKLDPVAQLALAKLITEILKSERAREAADHRGKWRAKGGAR